MELYYKSDHIMWLSTETKRDEQGSSTIHIKQKKTTHIKQYKNYIYFKKQKATIKVTQKWQSEETKKEL